MQSSATCGSSPSEPILFFFWLVKPFGNMYQRNVTEIYIERGHGGSNKGVFS